MTSAPLAVAITGASGLIGTALTRSLQADGHRVVPLVRGTVPPGADGIPWDPEAGRLDAAALEGIDAVVHLAGAGIGDHRWTDDYKRTVLESRTKGTSLLAEALAGLDRKPRVLVSGSAIGFYGDRGDEVLTEASASGDGFLAEVCRRWEASAAPAIEAGIRTPLARTGIVLTPDGGALPKLLPLFKFGLGGKMGDGRQWWSWVSLDDEVRALRFLIDHDVSGPVNITAPSPVTNAEFTKVLARVLGRPAFLPVPRFGPRLLRGAELADELLFASQRVEPAALTAAGFGGPMSEQQVSVSRVIDAPPEKIFAVLTDPALHAVIDGSGSVQGTLGSAERLRLGSTFGMRMRIGLPYPIRNKVVEYEENRLIAWRHFGRHRWRYTLEPVDGGTRVTETFDWSTAISPWAIERMGYPTSHVADMEKTLERLDDYVT